MLLAACLALASAAASPSDPAVAFEHVTVLSVKRGRARTDQTVLVRGDRIVSVEPTEGSELPEDAEVIDGTGRFLMPGLADMHVHLNDPRDGLLYVANGVTTIRNLSGQPFHLDLEEAYARGEYIGPRLVSSGPQVRLPASAGPDEAASVVAEHQAAGYACVKLYGNTSRENYEAMAEASHELGMPIVGHIPRNLTLEAIIEVGGHKEISHAEELLYAFLNHLTVATDAAIEQCVVLLADKGIALTATLTVYKEIAPQITDLATVLARPEVRTLPPLARIRFGPGFNKYPRDFEAGDVVPLQEAASKLIALTGALHRAGVPILLGTDAMNPSVVPGFSIHDELALLVEAGFEPHEALAAGSTKVAEYWDAEEDFGRVSAGQRADLVLLEADPFEDVAHFRETAGVMVRGRWYSRAALDAALEEQIEAYAAEEVALVGADRHDVTPILEALAEIPDEEFPGEPFFLSLASTYTLGGNFDGVARILDLVVDRFPGSVLMSNLMAETLLERGEVQLAREWYGRTLELDPANGVARRALGR